MVSRRHRARFFSRSAPAGFSRLTLRKRKVPPFRYVVLILVTLGGLSLWSFWGGSLMASLNPDLRMQFHLMTPALDAWITPPEYTNLPPIMIATPAGARYGGSVIDVPTGSTLTAHLADNDGGAPDLLINGETVAFKPDSQGGFEVAEPVHAGDLITVRHSWHEMDAWHIRIIPDAAPKVSFTDPLSVSEHKAVRLSYEATDDYGIATIVARITPKVSVPRADVAGNNAPVDILLASPGSKDVHRVSFEDLTAYPWAGSPVQIRLIVTDVGGHTTETDPVDFTVPARVFTNPIARALIEERGKLIKNATDENIRNEVANVMAGVAHVPQTYHGDAVVLMSLRSGAVRLVLDHNPEVFASVDNLLWQAAVRIEDGTAGIAERRLREAQSELADALDRNAPNEEVDALVDRLHDALAAYMSVISSRTTKAGQTENFSQVQSGASTPMAPKDMERIIQNIRDLSTSGSNNEALDELLKLEQKVESFKNPVSSFSEEMQKRARALNYPDGAHDSAEHAAPAF